MRRQFMFFRLSSNQAQREREAILSLIDKLGERITNKIDLDETLNIITEYIVEATKAESGAIFILDKEAQTLQAQVVVGPFPPLHETHEHVLTRPKYLSEKLRTDKIRVGEGIVGSAAQQKGPLLVTDAESDPRVPRHASLLNAVHSLMLYPLRVRDEMLGVFVVVNKVGEQAFNNRDVALLQALADHAAITVDLVKLYDVLAEQQRIEHELRIAHEFQKMLLPRTFPLIHGFDLDASSEAAQVVGGDYFDFFFIDQTHLGLVIADVSGKGVPGALIMAMVRAVLRAEARGCLSPRDVLKRVNERLIVDTKENVFTTMTYGILDIESGEIRFARAGHEPLLIVNTSEESRQVEQYSPQGMALGLFEGDLFDFTEDAVIVIQPGEIALLYTDGVIEAMDQNSIEYGRDRLIQRLRRREYPSAAAIVKDVLDDIHQFTLGIPQHDDITLLAIRRLKLDELERAESDQQCTA